MGNRCFITTKEKKMGVYLHWNGGIESVASFLKYCELQGYRKPEQDTYGWARLCQVICNFFGGSTSLGVDRFYNMTEDNGTYIIENWKVVGREFSDQEQLKQNLKIIDSKQPEHMQLGEFLDAIEVPVSEIKIGDQVFVEAIDCKKLVPVVGIGRVGVVNGVRTKDRPFVGLYDCGNGDYSDNCNNYITTETVWLKAT